MRIIYTVARRAVEERVDCMISRKVPCGRETFIDVMRIVVSVVRGRKSARERKGKKEENRGEHSGRGEGGEACRTFVDLARWSKLSATNKERIVSGPEARAAF